MLGQVPTTVYPGVDWLSLLQTFGLAVTILAAVGVALYRTLSWTGREVIIPLRDRALARFVTFCDAMQATVSKLDVNMDRMLGNLDKQTSVLTDLEEASLAHKIEVIRMDAANTEKMGKLDALMVGQTEVMAEIEKLKDLVSNRGKP